MSRKVHVPRTAGCYLWLVRPPQTHLHQCTKSRRSTSRNWWEWLPALIPRKKFGTLARNYCVVLTCVSTQCHANHWCLFPLFTWVFSSSSFRESSSRAPAENTLTLSEQLSFVCSVRISDLDPKSVHSIKKHQQRDVEMFESVNSLYSVSFYFDITSRIDNCTGSRAVYN